MGLFISFGILTGSALANQTTATTQAKDQLSPHSLMVASSLKGMLADVQGLKSQIATVSNPSSPESIQHVAIYQNDLQHELDQANTHDQELRGTIQGFPALSKSSEFKDMEASLRDLKNIEQKVLSKLTQKNYLLNKSQIIDDLDQLGKKLDVAINKFDSFNTKKLDIQSS